MKDAEERRAAQNVEYTENGEAPQEPMTPCCRRNAEELGEGWLYDVFFGETAQDGNEETQREQTTLRSVTTLKTQP